MGLSKKEKKVIGVLEGEGVSLDALAQLMKKLGKVEDLSAEEQKMLEQLRAKEIRAKDLKDILDPAITIGQLEIHSLGKLNKIGIVSDTHLGDRECRLKELQHFYRVLKKEGVKKVVHAGDVVTGVGIYRNQHRDLTHHTIDDQVRLVRDEYPDDVEATYFITGNHDLDGTAAGAGIDVGVMIAGVRKDLIYLGKNRAKVDIDGVQFLLQHGSGGGAYALSYKLQKYIEAFASGTKPAAFILGHFHTAISAFIRNVHAMTGGTFQGENDFSIRKGLPSYVGGWIVDFKTKEREEKKGEKTITSWRPEWRPYYQ